MSESADIRSRLRDNIAAIESRIAAACARAGRQRPEVTLVAVTKYVTPEVAVLLPELGILDLGESRPQELWRKAAALPSEVRWHLIGHLQRNKVERTLPLVKLIHSVDSVRLLESLQKTAEQQERQVHVLLEVNLSREPNKHGFDPDPAPLTDLLISWPYPHLEPRGLMTMAAEADDPECCRSTFAALRELGDSLRSGRNNLGAFRELSMGMTGDFEVAIEEGATLVRIGSALFDGIRLPEPPL